MKKICCFIFMLSFILFANEKIDFREAILNRGIRISINEKEISEKQCLLFHVQNTWLIGIYYNNEWNNTIIPRNNKYNQIINTPYSVKLSNNSLSVLINDDIVANLKPIPTKGFGYDVITHQDTGSSFLFKGLIMAIIFIIIYKILYKKKVVKL